MARSRYDGLHDRFDPIKTGKAGTRYERLAAMVLKAPDDFEGERVIRVVPDGWALSVAGGAPIPFTLMDLFYVMADKTEISEITSNRIAELILYDLSGRDMIIYADQLERHQVGPGGVVS